MIQKKQVTVGRLIGVYKDRGHHDYAIITWVDLQQGIFRFTPLDTLVESKNVFIAESLNEVFPTSKKEVFLYFSNQQINIDEEFKKLQDVKLHLTETHVKAKEFIKTITAK
ncbi:MAG: hypothetical protein WCP92_08745 [bacterium]